MMIAPARVQGPCARVDNGNARFTYHRVSEPVVGALPLYKYDKPRVRSW